jgi:hypothetical protein
LLESSASNHLTRLQDDLIVQFQKVEPSCHLAKFAHSRPGIGIRRTYCLCDVSSSGEQNGYCWHVASRWLTLYSGGHSFFWRCYISCWEEMSPGMLLRYMGMCQPLASQWVSRK